MMYGRLMTRFRSQGTVFAWSVRVEGDVRDGKVSDTRFSLRSAEGSRGARARATSFLLLQQHADDSDSSNRVTGSPRNARRSFPIRLNGRRLVLPGYVCASGFNDSAAPLLLDTTAFSRWSNRRCREIARAAALIANGSKELPRS